MEKPWLRAYPPGVPAELPIGEEQSLTEWFAACCRRYGDLPAFASLGQHLTYAELQEQANALASVLVHQLHLAPGSRVALLLPNLLQYPVCLFGIWLAGCVAVPCNPEYTPRELETQLGDAEVDAIIVVELFARTLQQTLPRLRRADGSPLQPQVIVTRVGDLLGSVRGRLIDWHLRYWRRQIPGWHLPQALMLADLLEDGATLPPAGRRASAGDLALLQYTGGTTGVPKGAMLTHRNLLANLAQAKAWCSSVLEERKEVVITALPLYHIFALTANCLLFVELGGCNELVANARDIGGLVGLMARTRFTAMTGVNTLFLSLLDHPDLPSIDFSRLKIALGGGMAVQAVVAERWQRATGCLLIEAYGLTETSPAVTINPLGLTGFNGSIGLPLPSTDLTIRDDAGNDLPAGRLGEICVHGPQVMQGYWRQPAETADAFWHDDFLRTGDIGMMDEHGFFRLLDRKKDVIVVSGFNVYPNEVEAVARSHPGVDEVAAVAQRSVHSGEVVKLVVVRSDPSLTAEALQEFCRVELAPYKVPQQIEFCEHLPRNPVGKILRRRLREESPRR